MRREHTGIISIYVKIRRQEEFKLADEDELTVTWDSADHDGHRHHKTAKAGVRYTYTVRGVNKDSVLSPRLQQDRCQRRVE